LAIKDSRQHKKFHANGISRSIQIPFQLRPHLFLPSPRNMKGNKSLRGRREEKSKKHIIFSLMGEVANPTNRGGLVARRRQLGMELGDECTMIVNLFVTRARNLGTCLRLKMKSTQTRMQSFRLIGNRVVHDHFIDPGTSSGTNSLCLLEIESLQSQQSQDPNCRLPPPLPLFAILAHPHLV
jgi:NTP pyrophosphatase (non-canonical NTP hydrolase)